MTVVGGPDFRLEEDVLTGYAGAADALADLALVAVSGGGIDVPVADAQRGLDRVGGLLRGGLEDAQTDGGQFDAVVQGQQWCTHGVQSMRSGPEQTGSARATREERPGVSSPARGFGRERDGRVVVLAGFRLPADRRFR